MFKTCPNCEQKWPDRSSFLSDKTLKLVGYQVHFEELTLGLFLFNHDCKSTIAVKAEAFTDLYEDRVFSEKKTGSDDCPGYCLEPSILSACKVECECAYIRECMQIIKNWQDENQA